MQVENKEFIDQDSIKNLDHAGDAPVGKEEETTPAPEKDETVEKTEGKEPEVKEEEPVKKDEEDAPEKLRERTKKAEEEKEKMLQALRKTKSEYRKLASEKKKEEEEGTEEEEDTSEWDDDSKKFRKETIELATRKAEEAIERSNETQAIDAFMEKYPEFVESEYWTDLVANYSPKRGKSSVSAIVRDLENARLITLNDRGELEKQFASAEQRGVAKGIKKAVVAEMALSGRSGKGTGSSKGASSTASDMAKKMNLDSKKVEKEDDSSEAVIKF